MYSSELCNLLNLTTKLCSFFGVITFTFNVKSKKFVSNRALRRRQWSAFSLEFGVALGILFRTLQTIRRGEFDVTARNQVPFCCAFLFAMVCILVPLGILCIYRDTSVSAWNKVMDYNINFKRKLFENML